MSKKPHDSYLQMTDLMNSDKWLLILIVQIRECSKKIHLQELHKNVFQTDVKASVVLMELFSETSFRATLFLYYLSFCCLWSIIQKGKPFD